MRCTPMIWNRYGACAAAVDTLTEPLLAMVKRPTELLLIDAVVLFHDKVIVAHLYEGSSSYLGKFSFI